MTTNDPTILHENDNYFVKVINSLDWADENGNIYENNYGVFHKETGVLEFYSPQLAAALFNSESFNSVVVDKPYLWQFKARQEGTGDIIEGEKVSDADEVH